MATTALRKPKATPAKPKVPDAPGSVVAETLKFGDMDFVLERGVAIPEGLVVARVNELPFKPWFNKMDHGTHIFLPNEFWTKRGVEDDKITGPYVKGKVRGVFNKWKDEDPLRSKHELLISWRPNGPSEKDTRPGYSLFMKVTA